MDWYDVGKRDLPWRGGHDPYATWVSEIMLQQTTVSAVIPYFERWMSAFPTIHDLASAPLDDVLKHWAGLGYYARARNLHKAAQIVVDKHDGVVPRDSQALLSLPGIGRYTAGAILSIAYNLDEPIVDANVIRVISRLFAVEGDPKTNTAVQRRIWEYAEELIPKGRASDFNQAMMELGALVCDPETPLCGTCVVRASCRAHGLGQATSYPQFVKKDKWTELDDVAVALRNRRGELLLAKRPASASLWGGLWELPRATRADGEELVDCAVRAVREGAGATAVGLRPFGVVNHVVAKRKITLYGYVADVASNEVDTVAGSYEAIAWEPPAGASKYAMSTPQVRLLAELAKFESQGTLEF